MVSRKEKRREAYKYIVKKLHELEWDIACKTDKTIEDVNYLSLAEIEDLKNCLTDPTEELVAGLKKLLHSVVSEQEIE